MRSIMLILPASELRQKYKQQTSPTRNRSFNDNFFFLFSPRSGLPQVPVSGFLFLFMFVSIDVKRHKKCSTRKIGKGLFVVNYD